VTGSAGGGQPCIDGHRSGYPSQKLNLAKPGDPQVPLGGSIGDVRRDEMRIRKGHLPVRVRAPV
jgi:hypothetical protein